MRAAAQEGRLIPLLLSTRRRRLRFYFACGLIFSVHLPKRGSRLGLFWRRFLSSFVWAGTLGWPFAATSAISLSTSFIIAISGLHFVGWLAVIGVAVVD